MLLRMVQSLGPQRRSGRHLHPSPNSRRWRRSPDQETSRRDEGTERSEDVARRDFWFSAESLSKNGHTSGTLPPTVKWR